MPEAQFRLQSISSRLQADGFFSKLKQELVARAKPSAVQEGKYLISW
jgi:hypothetical protein